MFLLVSAVYVFMSLLAASFLHRLLFHVYSRPFMFLSSLTQKRCTFIALAITSSQRDPATTRVRKSKTGFGKSVACNLAFISRPSPSIHPSIPSFLLLLFRLAGGAGSGLPCPFFHPENTLLPPPALMSWAEYRAQC